jgi:hypothetical protein
MWLEAHQDMVPTLEAEESLNLVNVIVAASGKLKPSDLRSLLKRWSDRLLHHDDRAKKKLDIETLKTAGIGIGVKLVPKSR